MPEKFSSAGYKAPSFLSITGHIFTIWIAFAILVALAHITFLFKHHRIRKVGYLVRKHTFYNGIFYAVLVSCVYLMIGFMLNFRYGNFDSPSDIVNACLSVLSVLGMVYFIYIVLYLTIKYANRMQDKTYEVKYGELTKDIKQD